jgi:hypothetical protein
MAAESLAVVCAVALLAGCASQSAGPRMGGFSDDDARAPARAEPVDPCSFRTGRLVIEVEEALVREYPHYGVTGSRSEEPMLLTVLAPGAPDAAARAAEVAVQIAPAAYRPGDRILALEGRRLLDKPLRTLRGRRLTVRLAENDRSSAPHWAGLTEDASSAGGGALSAVGVPGGGALTEALELIRKLDRDDLVLLADVDVDALAATLTATGGAQRLRFQTNRRTVAGAEAGRPVAELALLAYREPESGCR